MKFESLPCEAVEGLSKAMPFVRSFDLISPRKVGQVALHVWMQSSETLYVCKYVCMHGQKCMHACMYVCRHLCMYVCV